MSKKTPRKPDRPIGAIIFPKSGPVRRELEHLPREQKPLELIIGQKFVGAITHFGHGILTDLRLGDEPADLLCTDAAGHPVGIQVTEMVDEFARIESKGWKATEGTAVSPDSYQGRIYRALMHHYSSRGEGTVYQYWYNEKLVATDLWLHRSGAIFLLKTTYDENQDTTSPTMLMREEMFRAVFDHGMFKRIDFNGGLMNWHKKWTEETRTMFHINIYRWPFLGGLRTWLGR